MSDQRPTTDPNPFGIHILAGGGARALIDQDGCGFLEHDGLLGTGWSGDPLDRREGHFLHVRDTATGTARVVGRPRHPGEHDRCRLDWEPGAAVVEDLRDGVDVFLEICVDPISGAELRAVTLANRDDVEHEMELTSLVEPVLLPGAAHWSHPVFSKLFIQTEALRGRRALLARRRPRGADERHPCLLHAMPGDAPVRWESDREALVRRGSTASLADPDVARAPLRDVAGNVLDPVLALRRTLTLPPGESALVTLVTAVAPDPAAAAQLTERFADDAAVLHAFRTARGEAAAALNALGLDVEKARAWNRALAGMLVDHPDLVRSAPDAFAPEPPAAPPSDVPYAAYDGRGRSLPDPAALLAMLSYWRTLAPEVELVLLLDDDAAAPAHAPGLRALRTGELAPREDARLIAGAALLLDARGDVPTMHHRPTPAAPAAPAGAGRLSTAEPLRHFNGHGGFHQGGHEYVIRVPSDADGRPVLPPRPWVNIIANPGFGCLVSDTGSVCTWSGNSREHRVTPWNNDPLLDPHGEAVWIADLDEPRAWSATPGPRPDGGDYEVRHGFGVTRFLREGQGLTSDTTIGVHAEQPVRFTTVRLSNRGRRPRRLAAVLSQRLVLGDRPGGQGRFVRTWQDQEAGLLLARNVASGPFAGRVTVATSACTLPGAVVRRGTDAALRDALGVPAAHGAGHGAAAGFVQRVELTLEPGQEALISFLLADGDDESHARRLAADLREPAKAGEALTKARDRWRALADGLQVETPSSALDLMVNGWLAYQTLSCRIWGRSAFYQSGGAFGYRDQLQDSTAFLFTRPELCREQILLHAGHQFTEGDVLHWWHPPLDRGLRTRFVDDLLWLPLLTGQYLDATGDLELLDERAPLLQARLLADGEDEAFLAAKPSGRDLDVYGHCCLAIDRSLETGEHGLPLFGCGDWNDGMNRVGRLGRGESVWMGFFLCSVLDAWIPLCEARGDAVRARTYQTHRDRLAVALDQGGWDGAWYRRGYYDDGAPLGSKDSDECQLDTLAQAWSVLSGVAPRERAESAMDAVERTLVDEDAGIVKLLAPAFVDTPHDPGYIKGYVAGVRENGGQYTHAALWYIKALAQLGRRDRAARLLEMLTPVKHAETPAQVARYRIEPYVVAADVYGVAPHVGRGGWSWYTGSSCWMLRAAVESILGLQVMEGSILVVDPCIPDDWPGYAARWRNPQDDAEFTIRVTVAGGRPETVTQVHLDGAPLTPVGGAAVIPLPGDGEPHEVRVELGPNGK